MALRTLTIPPFQIPGGANPEMEVTITLVDSRGNHLQGIVTANGTPVADKVVKRIHQSAVTVDLYPQPDLAPIIDYDSGALQDRTYYRTEVVNKRTGYKHTVYTAVEDGGALSWAEFMNGQGPLEGGELPGWMDHISDTNVHLGTDGEGRASISRGLSVDSDASVGDWGSIVSSILYDIEFKDLGSVQSNQQGHGVFFNIDATMVADPGNNHFIFGNETEIAVRGAYPLSDCVGIVGSVDVYESSVDYVYAIRGELSTSFGETGPIGNAFGVTGNITSLGGVISLAAGLRSLVDTYGGELVSEGIGVLVAAGSHGGGGSMGKFTGLKIEDASANVSGEHFAIDSEWNGPSRLAGALRLPNLATSDPGVAGELWNDNGTVKVSAG